MFGKRWLASALGMLGLVLPAGAHAGTYINIGSTTITPGSPASIDVTIAA